MKNLGTILAAAFLALVLALYMCTFQVRFTEVAIKKTWGKPAEKAIDQPGLYFKAPRPVQTVVRYDKRTRLLEDRTEETRTVDGKNLLLTTYTLWRIADPVKFLTNFPGGVEDGERKLRTTIVTQKQALVGKRKFSEFVSTNAEDRHLGEIEAELKEAVARDAMREFGVEVVAFGFKKLALPESVTTAVFSSMKEHEQSKAAQYRAEGEARAADIMARAKAMEERILAAARQKAAQIEAEAQRVVSGYYKEFDVHPELRIFLDKLRTIRQALRERTTLVIDTKQAPWDVFNAEDRRRIPEGASLPTTSDDGKESKGVSQIASPTPSGQEG
ncbi:MAG: hypothetical protein J5J06_00875 [Phycisphaerae bacterium]|nr:hypothetical protein [Phycisphaerae bacterium]